MAKAETLDGICHAKHEPINIDSETKARLRALLFRSEMKGVGYSAFIDIAIREMEGQLADCGDEGDERCMTHDSPYESDTQCEAKGWTLAAINVAREHRT